MKNPEFDPWDFRIAPGRLSVCLVAVLMFLLNVQYVKSAPPDLQLWLPTQIIHPIGKDWAISMNTEVRLQDDISEFSRLVYKPALNYHFSFQYQSKASQETNFARSIPVGRLSVVT